MVLAEKLTRTRRDPDSMIEKEIDLGFVGRPVKVSRRVLDTLIGDGIIPVIAPVAAGAGGETYNVNADTMAGAVAGALNAARLMLLTDVPGVLAKDGSLITDLTPGGVAALIKDGTIAGGMIPKLETCLGAVEAGVEAAVVLDGRVPHGLLLEIFTRRGAGTLVKSS